MITLDDYEKKCGAENGGAESLIILENCNIASYTISGRKITAITLKAGKQAYSWTPDMESILATDFSTRTRTNNSYFRDHAVTITLKDDESSTSKLDEEIGRAFVVVFVKYSVPIGETSKYKAFGFINGMVASTTEATVGQLFEDIRGHVINFVGKELTIALEIDTVLVESLLTPLS